jgi:chemotaxis protein histidine kinase CheA/ActR/RegA family two-component response regulator
MQPEQQKRILGYFIEEAKEHLNTIEHSLLNLQSAVDDAEMLNEVFRAAHSVKGGAAMLGIYSIQQISHRLEDYFKILKENPVKVDQKLESLFFRSFDALSELVEELQGPFGLTDEVAENALQRVEPVFTELHTHLNHLVAGGEGVVEIAPEPEPALATSTATDDSALQLIFHADVPNYLRQILQLLRQPEAPARRQQIEGICQRLAQFGEEFSLPTWSQLLVTAQAAISNSQIRFADLAPVLIQDLKAARDLVLSGRAAEITPTSQLTAFSVSASGQGANPDLDIAVPPTWIVPTDADALLADLFEEADAIADEESWTEEDLIPALSADDAEEMDLAVLFESDDISELEQQEEPLLDEFLTGTGVFSDLSVDLTEDESLELVASQQAEADFEDLEALLRDNFQTSGSATSRSVDRSQVTPGFSSTSPGRAPAAKPRVARRAAAAGFEKTMKVPVKHLDTLSNLVGELVVNRNSMEDSQEKMRQFLDNLLFQVQQLGDVSQQMQELYERSLLESSLLSSPNGTNFLPGGNGNSSGNGSPTGEHATGANFDALEMDRFTGFHSLSQEIIERIVRVRESASDIEFVVDKTEQVTRMFRQVTSQVQEGLSRSRMIPFAQIADRLPRAVRDLSLKCGKQARLEIEGRDTLVDKGILERLYDPMTHLVNNAIYHGIESPEVRQALGKPPEGTIKIRAFYQGSQTIISITDDGGGIDPERVKAKAIQKGTVSADSAANLSRQDIYGLLFLSGFSTQDVADELAGRGVGMDVVRTSLDEIRGAINTDSTVGQGTTFTIRLPLTLSIAKALCCVDNYCRIAFPIDGVEDMIDISKDRLQQNGQGQQQITWRNRQLPFHRLSDLLPYQRQISRSNIYAGGEDEDIISVVILRSANDLIAVQVDQVVGEQEIVIKQLSGPVPKPIGIAGVTVQGDGHVMTIADVLELIDLSLGRLEVNRNFWGISMPTDNVEEKTQPVVLIVDDSITVRELLSMTFNKVGYRVEQARDGQEAWEKLRSGLPCDLVFCDIEMPRMDGLALLQRIQEESTLSHLPIAMLTSRGADRHRQMAVQLGAKAYFTKPYLEEALLDAANRMLKGEVLLKQPV